MKYHIEKNTVQETLIIPLYARKVCSEHFPALFSAPEAERICGLLDIYRDVGAFHRLMIRFCDGMVNMRIVKISFKGE